MNTNSTLLEKLLKLAKRHKVLTYPVLILVVIISFIRSLFSWSTGAGKRIVAVVMIMVMLVSQSYFLTSSATELVDDENAALMQLELQQGSAGSTETDVDSNEALSAEDVVNQPEEIITEAVDNVETVEGEGTGDVVDGENTAPTDIVTEPQGEDVENGEDTLLEDTQEENGDLPKVQTQDGLLETEDTEATTEASADAKKVQYCLYYQGESGIALVETEIISSTEKEGDQYVYNLSSICAGATAKLTDEKYTHNGCYAYSQQWYYDQACTNPVTDTTKVIPNKGNMIQLYCSREIVRYQVTVSNTGSTSTEPSSFSTTAAESGGYYYVNVSGEGSALSGSMDLVNITRKGHTLTDISVKGGSGTLSSENSAIVTFSGTDVNKEISLVWKAAEYTIQYAKNDKGEIAATRTVTYDGSDTFIDGTGLVDEKEGFTFSGWRVGLNGSEVKAGHLVSTVQNELYEQSVILYPVYDYNNFEITHDFITYQYKEPADEEFIQARYIGEEIAGGNNFTYAVISGKEELEGMGINVYVSDSGINLKTYGPTRATGSSSVELKFTVTDKTAPEGEGTQTFSVFINVKQIELSIVNPTDGSNVKTYDGTTDSKVTEPLATSRDDVMVSFENAYYNSPNVAEANTIVLEGIKLVLPSGEDANNYSLLGVTDGTYSIPGTITQRTVYLKTYAELTNGKDYICAGEADPVFKVEEDVEEKNEYQGFVAGDSIESLGEITFTTDRPEDLTIEGTYSIWASSDAASNYKVKVDREDEGQYKVVMEDPEDGENYEISGTLGNKNWYIQNPAQAKALGGYDTVRISKDGSTVFATGSVVDLSEKDYPRDTDIYIQLYNSVTGAVTSWKYLEIKLDQNGPEFISYTLTQDNTNLYDSAPVEGGLYFPTRGMLTFGSYFNKTVTVTVKYKDETSGLSTLHYGLYGEAADSRSAKFGITDADGYAIASFEILKEAVEKTGVISYYAEDIAGNKGAEYNLERDGATDWGVEMSGPVIDTFAVKAGEKQLEYVVNGSSEYYANCTAFLEVTDMVSGIYSIEWNVNGTSYGEERVSNTSAKQTQWTFSKDINHTNFASEGGYYSIFAIVRDNAGNEVSTDTMSFYVDDEPPVITITSDYDVWQQKARVEFEAYDLLSGIKYINVTDANGNIIDHHVDRVENGISYCYFEVAERGTYQILVCDKAGNLSTESINVQKVSVEVPMCPEVTITPAEPEGNDGWYLVAPTVSIPIISETTDGAPVDTKYQLWNEGETAYNETTLPRTDKAKILEFTEDGIYNLRAWSENTTGVPCEGEHQYQIKVDLSSPKIDFTTTKGTDSTVLVNFTISDTGSGVDKDSIKILYGDKEIVTSIEENEEGYSGSFEVAKVGNYIIHAADKAGNVADEAAFTPMSMKVKAVTNISATSATLRANVMKGTFDITSATLSYKKLDGTYTEVDSATNTDANGNIALSAVLSDLDPATVYAYRVVAVSAGSEVLEYDGYFKTLEEGEYGISLMGTARYADGASGDITVGLFEGNTCIMALEVEAGNEFIFSHVNDGTYNIVATDGTYSKTMRVMIKDGMIVYPEKYIDLVLSGKNTSVVITTDKTPNITADNLDSIFEDDPINFTESDDALIADGGIVEFRLYATLMSVSEVSANEISAMYDVADKNKIVGAYIDLSLYKIVTDAKGNTERTRVTELANGANVSVTIPLGDLAKKSGLEVIRIHDTGDSYLGASLVDRDTNPYTYTVSTNQFSTYAVLHDKVTATTQQITTKEPVDEPVTTQAPKTTQDDDEPIVTTGDDDPVDGTTQEKTTQEKTTEKPHRVNTNGGGSGGSGRSSSSVGSLRSSGSAKTGDATPIAAVGATMMLALAGLVVLRKKGK